ncbi:MAG: lamin tail domain-containing protein [Acidimicrobiales bacterium]
MTLVVLAGNDAPTVDDPGQVFGAEQTPMTPLTLTWQDIDGDNVTFAASGLPSGVVVSPTGVLSGTPADGAEGTYDVEVTATDDGEPAMQGSVTIELVVGLYAESNLAGSIVINEVMPHQILDNNEFVELYNTSGASIDLTGWKLWDDDYRSGFDGDLAWTFPATDSRGQPSTLAPGSYAVIWLNRLTAASPVIDSDDVLEYTVGSTSTKLSATGDDVWLLEADNHLVDIVVFGTGSAIDLPPAGLDMWDDTHRASLAPGTTSVSLTPNGVDGDDSACWEPTGSDEASGRCAGWVATTSNGVVAGRPSSPGSDNNALPPDAGGPYLMSEGDSLVLSASGGSAGASWSWDLNGDDTPDVSGQNPTVDWATLSGLGLDDDGVYTVSVTASGLESTASLTIDNTAPTLTVSGDSFGTVGQAYSITLAASDPGDDSVAQWIVNWGDGTISTYSGMGGAVSHTYQTEGFQPIAVSATDEDGRWFEADLLVAGYDQDQLFRFAGTTGDFIQALPTGDKPVQPLAAPQGRTLVSNEGSNNVVYFDAGYVAQGEFITAGSGGLSQPGGIAIAADGSLWVASGGSNEVKQYNTTGTWIGDFTSSATDPHAIEFDGNGDAYVASYADDLVRRFPSADALSGVTFVASGSGGLDKPEQMAFGPDGNLYVASLGSDAVLRFDGSSGAFIDAFVPAGGSPALTDPSGLAFGPDGLLYVSNYGGGGVFRYDGTTGAYVDTFVAPGANGLTGPAMIEFAPDHAVLITN